MCYGYPNLYLRYGDQRFDGHALRFVLHNPLNLCHFCLHLLDRFRYLCRGRAHRLRPGRRLLCNLKVNLHLGCLVRRKQHSRAVVGTSHLILHRACQERATHAAHANQ
jgi:hypothetical protein